MKRAVPGVPRSGPSARGGRRGRRQVGAAHAPPDRTGRAAAEALEGRLLFAAVQWGQYLAGGFVRAPGDGFLVNATASGDFNGDGNPDTAVLTPSGQPRVALTDARGVYTSLVAGTSGFGSPKFLTTGDLNGDGRLDLLALDAASDSAVIYYGNGDDSFQPPVTYPTAGGTGVAPTDAVVGDFNGDGRPDFAVANNGANSISLYLGQAGASGGGFEAAAPLNLLSQPAHLFAGDLDGDGKTDLAVAYATQDAVVLWGNGDGTFTQTPITVPPVLGQSPAGQTQILAGDLNGDGRKDLVIGENSGDPQVLLGTGARAFSAPSAAGDATIYSGSSVAIANLTNDGKPDLLVLSGTGTAWALVGNGDGTFTSGGFFNIPSSGSGPSGFGDFNHDGLTDFYSVISGVAQTYLAADVAATPSGAQLNGYQVTNAVLATGVNNLTPDTPTAGVTVSIDWGDGVVSAGSVVPAPGGPGSGFQIVGSHTYTRYGTYNIFSRVAGPNNVAVAVNGGSDSAQDIPAPASLKVLVVALPSVATALIQGPAGKLWFPLTQASTLNLLSTDGTTVSYRSPVTPFAAMPLAPDATGNAWLCNPNATGAAGAAGTLYRVDAAGKVTTYAAAGTVNALGAGPSGQMWFLSGPNATTDNALGVVNSDGSIQTVPLSTSLSATAGTDLLFGPGGTFWVAEAARGAIARITTDGTVTEIPLPASKPAAAPSYVTIGPDGNLWYADPQSQSVGKITSDGSVTRYAINFDANRICAGPDGALWITGTSGGLGRVTTDGSLSGPLLIGISGINSVAAGSDGNLYFTNNGSGGFSPSSAVFRLDLHNVPTIRAIAPVSLRPGDQLTDIATFTDPTGTRSASDFVATVRWENGSEEPANVVAVPGVPGGFAVQGPHTYKGEGNFQVTVTVTPHFDVPVDATTTVQVDYPIAPAASFPAVAVAGRASDPLALASFTDSDPSGGSAGTFTAAVTWGDGQSSAGTVVPGAAKGTFVVQGTHRYGAAGSYPVHVTINDYGGAPIAADTTVTVVSPPPLQPPATYNAPAGLLAVADFNGDGVLDLASATPGQPQIDLLLGQGGQGRGTYSPAALAATAGGPAVAMAAGDFNHDGRADLAVTTNAAAGERTEIYLGTSAGTLAAADSFATRSGSIVAGDFNGDGVSDLATADASSSDLVIALGKGDGTFTTSTVALAGGTSSLVAADFNGDKRDDLAAVLAGTTTVRVLLANAGGTFAAPITYAGAPVATSAAGALAAAGDFNGDGRKDLAVADPSTNTLLLLAGNGDGTFGSFGAAGPLLLDEGKAAGAADPPTAGLLAADVNGDGADDLVRVADPASPGQAALDVKLGEPSNGARPLTADVSYAVPGHGPFAAAARDLNGDGRTDLVVGGAAGTTAGAGAVDVLINSPYTLSAVHPSGAITEGAPLTGATLGTLVSSAGPLASAAGFSASIDWGDGTSSPATLNPNATGGIDVVGAHAWQQAGTYTVTLTVTDAFGVRSTASQTLTVADAPFQAAGGAFNATTNVPLTALVATFTDANPFSRPGDLSAQITWGNAGTNPGIVLSNGNGSYSVLGTRTYANAGTYIVTVSLQDAAGARTTATSTVVVKPPANGGGSISGAVYDDVNFDRTRQGAEPPLAGWSVFLDANDNGSPDPGEPVAVTSAAGQYVFPDVAAGNWVVRLIAPARAGHWQQTAPDPASADGGAQVVTLATGQTVGGTDFGATPAPSARVDAGPAVRGTPLDAATVAFSEPVVGQLSISALSLTLNGGPNLLSGAQSVSTADHVHFQVGNLSALTAAPGTYVLTLLDPAASGAVFTDSSGNALASGASATFTVAAPAVTSVVVNDGSAQRSMVTGLTVTFNQPVSLDAGAFSLAGRNGAGAGTSVTWSNPAGDGRTWLLSFTGPGVTGGSAADGAYDLKVNASAVHPVGAAPGSPTYSMPADYAYSFFRLFGDADGNGTVNAADYARFKQAFGTAAGSAAYNAAFDFDGNGMVNALDYAQFKTAFGKSLA